jgi:hypothetical protein
MSHRWAAPANIDQVAWEAGMRAHLDEHATAGPADERVRMSRRDGLPRRPEDLPPPDAG